MRIFKKILPILLLCSLQAYGQIGNHQHKYTGQNVSTHIRSRILDERKTLLVQTDWPLQDIGFAIGFADQPNFTQFFKKNTGVTPYEFRKEYKVSKPRDNK